MKYLFLAIGFSFYSSCAVADCDDLRESLQVISVEIYNTDREIQSFSIQLDELDPSDSNNINTISNINLGISSRINQKNKLMVRISRIGGRLNSQC